MSSSSASLHTFPFQDRPIVLVALQPPSLGHTTRRTARCCFHLFELLSPIHHKRLWKEEKSIRAFARQALMLGLDFASGEESSKIMGSLLRLGRPVNTLDVLISGIAVANAAETSDVRLRLSSNPEGKPTLKF